MSAHARSGTTSRHAGVVGRVAAGVDATLSFYRRPGAPRLLLLAAVLLFYAGSVPVYYVHAVVRGEAGPRIGHLSHWALDATLVFVGLTPALAVILPLAFHLVRRLGTARPLPFAALAALLLTLATGPGPFLHQLTVGRGTPLADLAERVLGSGAAPASTSAATLSDPLVEGLVQLVVGLPTYGVLLVVAVTVVGGCLTDPARPAVALPRQRTAPAGAGLPVPR